jgi:DNA-binding NarL/FixJ family response regulator
MNRLFVVTDEASVERATRFARRCSSGVNLFAVTAGDGSIREAVQEGRPDIAILVGIDHVETAARHVRELSDAAPSAVVLVLTAETDGEVFDEVCHAAMASVAGEPNGTPSDAGVNGHAAGLAAASTTPDRVSADTLAQQRERAAERCPLTRRELEVLCAAAEGQSNAEIGRQLWVTEQTVKFHLSNIYRKLGVSNRTEAMRRAIMRGFISAPRSVHEDSGRTAVMAR